MAKLKSAGITRQVPNFQGRPLSFLDRFAHPMGWKPALNPVKHCSFRKGRDPSPTNLCLRSANPVMFPPSEGNPPKSSRGFSSLQCVGSFFVFFFFLGGVPYKKHQTRRAPFCPSLSRGFPDQCPCRRFARRGRIASQRRWSKRRLSSPRGSRTWGCVFFGAPPKDSAPPGIKKGCVHFAGCLVISSVLLVGLKERGSPKYTLASGGRDLSQPLCHGGQTSAGRVER